MPPVVFFWGQCGPNDKHCKAAYGRSHHHHHYHHHHHLNCLFASIVCPVQDEVWLESQIRFIFKINEPSEKMREGENCQRDPNAIYLQIRILSNPSDKCYLLSHSIQSTRKFRLIFFFFVQFLLNPASITIATNNNLITVAIMIELCRCFRDETIISEWEEENRWQLDKSADDSPPALFSHGMYQPERES